MNDKVYILTDETNAYDILGINFIIQSYFELTGNVIKVFHTELDAQTYLETIFYNFIEFLIKNEMKINKISMEKIQNFHNSIDICIVDLCFDTCLYGSKSYMRWYIRSYEIN